ncbi:MAG TPA: Flp family type IVb pilin [Acidimicrobiia bacterium]|nr:Flp family type IVb pilin [Acidimicrobiia bacterium]
MQIFRRIEDEERVVGLVEYALITALIALMSFSAVTLLGDETSGMFY